MPDGQLYYAMEYVPGCDLEQVWRELSGRTWRGRVVPGKQHVGSAVLSASRKTRDQLELHNAGRPAATPGR